MKTISRRKPSTYKNLTGQKFGRLTVLNEDFIDKKHCIHWLCQCDCGRITSVRTDQLTSGRTKSCGCLAIEKAKESSLENSNKQRAKNIYEEQSNGTIFLYNKDKSDYTIIDKNAESFVKNFYWSKDSNGYWRTQVKNNQGIFYLHSFIYINVYGNKIKQNEIVDHSDRNKSNNLISNLRPATKQENSFNVEKKNTTYKKSWNKYIAQISYSGKYYYLGGYNTEEEANKIYQYVNKILFGIYSPYFKYNIDISNIILTKTIKERIKYFESQASFK